jgi:hypothetical protein
MKTVLKSLIMYIPIVCAVFFTHQWLKQFHFTYCNSDIFRILFIKNSNFCIGLGGIVDVLERYFFALVKT